MFVSVYVYVCVCVCALRKQARELSRRLQRAFSPVFDVSPAKSELEMQRQEWELEKADWERKKEDWLNVVQWEEERRLIERDEWLGKVQREMEKKLLERTRVLEEENMRIREKMEENNRILKDEMEKEMKELNQTAGWLVRERLKMMEDERERAIEEELKIEMEIRVWEEEEDQDEDASTTPVEWADSENENGKQMRSVPAKAPTFSSPHASNSLSMFHWQAQSPSSPHTHTGDNHADPASQSVAKIDTQQPPLPGRRRPGAHSGEAHGGQGLEGGAQSQDVGGSGDKTWGTKEGSSRSPEKARASCKDSRVQEFDDDFLFQVLDLRGAKDLRSFKGMFCKT